MTDATEKFTDVANLLRTERPKKPVYCVFPHVYRETAKEFLRGFPGRVLYAVKANSDPTVVRLLTDSGIRHFDCASLPEIELVDSINPDATKYFMIPTRIREAARTAQEKHAVRHFLVDHSSGLSQLTTEIETSGSVIFATPPVVSPARAGTAGEPYRITSGFNPTSVTPYTTGAGRELVLVSQSGAIGIRADDPSTPDLEGGAVRITEGAIDVFDAVTSELLAVIPLREANPSYDALAIDPSGIVASSSHDSRGRRSP